MFFAKRACEESTMLKRSRTAGGYVKTYATKRRRTGTVVVAGSRPMAPLATRGFFPVNRSRYRGSNPERKVYDIAVGTVQCNTSSQPVLIYVPVLGTDYTNRVGRKTVAKTVQVRGRCVLEPSVPVTGTTTAPSQQARCIVFVDYQPNATIATTTELLNTADPGSPLNLNNRDRFKVLLDKEYVFDAWQLGSTSTWNRTIHGVKMFKNINIESVFNGVNGGTIADISSGAIYMLWLGSNTAGTNTDINAYVSTRVRFVDA